MRIVLGSGHPMLTSCPDYTKLYNDAYGVVVGTKHPGALGRSCREVLAEAWDFIGPRFDTVFTEGQPISTLTHQLFTLHRKVGFPFVCRDASASGQLYRRLARPMGTGEHYRSMGERHQGG